MIVSTRISHFDTCILYFDMRILHFDTRTLISRNSTRSWFRNLFEFYLSSSIKVRFRHTKWILLLKICLSSVSRRLSVVSLSFVCFLHVNNWSKCKRYWLNVFRMTTKRLIEINDLLMTMQLNIQFQYRYKRDKRERSLKIRRKSQKYLNIMYKKADIVVEFEQRSAHIEMKNARIEIESARIEMRNARIDNLIYWTTTS